MTLYERIESLRKSKKFLKEILKKSLVAIKIGRNKLK